MMDTTAPSTVDGGVDVTLIQTEPNVLHSEIGVAKEATPLRAQPPRQAAVEKLRRGKGQGSDESWSPDAFYKDAVWFELFCGLPNEGESPHKISDITEEQLSACFGEGTRNGYKLSSCTGIPSEHILALSQVVDGYDKPVNGILSHTFVKGVYADMVLHRKVNWAAYAVSKLKGQVVQWSRDGKSKPDGPPCVRKPQRYVPPSSSISKSLDTVKCEGVLALLDKVSNVRDEDNHGRTKVRKISSSELGVAVPPLLARSPLLAKNLLVATMESEMRKMRTRLASVNENFDSVEASMNKLKSLQVGHVGAEITFESEIERLRVKEDRLSKEIAVEEESVEELTTDIELESNKQVDEDELQEVNTELLSFMETKLKQHQTTILSTRALLQAARQDTKHVRDRFERAKKCHANVPQTMSKLSVLSTALASERCKLESNLKHQEVELGILSDVLCYPCPAVIPTYTMTSTKPAVSEVTVSSCPICCNGYHTFNWIPASCGHTYHPVCLFTYLLSCKGTRECKACGKTITDSWLQTWGIGDHGPSYMSGTEESLGHNMMALDLEDLYGVNCRRLPERRELMKTMESMKTKDMNDIVGRCLVPALPSSTVEDYDTVMLGGDDRSSQMGLLFPKVEGEESGKDLKPNVDPRKKVKIKPFSGGRPRLQDVLTPSATLPFSPEAEPNFKKYSAIETPYSKREVNPSHVDTKLKKKLYST